MLVTRVCLKVKYWGVDLCAGKVLGGRTMSAGRMEVNSSNHSGPLPHDMKVDHK